MAQFKITLPQEARDELFVDKRDIIHKINRGELPHYEQFVWNLAKSMNTPAEELHHAATGISGEAGEIIDVSKKVWVYNKPLDAKNLVEELGDLRFYYQAMLNLLQLTDEVIVTQNMKKLSVRYADGKYSDAQAQARADKAPLRVDGSKPGAALSPELKPGRKFMGMVPVTFPELEDDNPPTLPLPAPPITDFSKLSNEEVEQRFNALRAESLSQLKRDEQP